MKRVVFVSLACAALVLALVAPAFASQGGISGTIPPSVAEVIEWPSLTLQLYGGNFQPGTVTFPVRSKDGAIVGSAYFRITWCQGFIGYRINVPGLGQDATLQVKGGDEVVAWADPLDLVDNPTADGLHAEGFMTWLDVDHAWYIEPNPSERPYPSIQKVYNALKNGTAGIVVSDSAGASVSGSNK